MWFLIITIISFLVGTFLSALGEVKKKDLSFLIYVCGFIGGITYVLFFNNESPTPMDVYQGKTTLEITYKDGIPIDSVVVFKDKKK